MNNHSNLTEKLTFGQRRLMAIWHRYLPYTNTQKNVMDFMASLCDFRGNFREWVEVKMWEAMGELQLSEKTIHRTFESLLSEKYIERQTRRAGKRNLPSLYRFTQKFFDTYAAILNRVEAFVEDSCGVISSDKMTAHDLQRGVKMTEREVSKRQSVRCQNDRVSSLENPSNTPNTTFESGTLSGAKSLQGLVRGILKANRIPKKRDGEFDANVSDNDIKATALSLWQTFGENAIEPLKAIRQECVSKPTLRIRDEISLERSVREELTREKLQTPPEAPKAPSPEPSPIPETPKPSEAISGASEVDSVEVSRKLILDTPA